MSIAKVAAVSGASSGIGRACAALLAARGWTVYDLSRHDGGAPGVAHIDADVCSAASLDAAMARIAQEAGGIGLLLACAGCGVSGAVEFIPEEDMRRQFDVNLLGTIRTVRAALPYMRRAGGGRILCVSSVAAVCAIPFQAYYSASKAGVCAFTDALRGEVAPFGIEAASVLPGDIRTGFTAARRKTEAGAAEYGGRIARSVAGMERDEEAGMTPEAAAREIVRIAGGRRLRPQYTIGARYRAVTALAKLLPRAAVNAIVSRLYGG